MNKNFIDENGYFWMNQPSDLAFEGLLRFVNRRVVVAKKEECSVLIKEGWMVKVPRGVRKRLGFPILYILTPAGKAFVENLENERR